MNELFIITKNNKYVTCLRTTRESWKIEHLAPKISVAEYLRSFGPCTISQMIDENKSQDRKFSILCYEWCSIVKNEQNLKAYTSLMKELKNHFVPLKLEEVENQKYD